MIEKIDKQPKPKFEKGQLVRLNPEIIQELGETYNSETAYRIYKIERHLDEGGDAAWIGPADVLEDDFQNFDPSQIMTEEYKTKYDRVIPIAITHLIKES